MSKFLHFTITLFILFILAWTKIVPVYAQQLNTSACPPGYTYNLDAKKCLTINLEQETVKIAETFCKFSLNNLISQDSYNFCVEFTAPKLYAGATTGGQLTSSLVDGICKGVLHQTDLEALNTCRSVLNGVWNQFSFGLVKAPRCANGLTASNTGICVKGGFTNTMSPEEGCENAINTALGCIPYETKGFTQSLLTFLAGTAGAIALVVMLIATIQIMTGGDNAEQVKKGKELFTGAVTGLLFIIFSVTLLRIVAGDIIKLPGFTP